MTGPSTMDTIDCLVIGAGVVGLAVARELALAGRDVLIAESLGDIGSVTSARNSEVIHAGIYYPQGSLKAQLCVEGRELLYRYCADHHIAHRRCGKLIVATSDVQQADLARIAGHAAANGVGDLRMISRDEARALESQLECTAALLSPSTGIVDSHGFMRQLLADAEAAGASLALRSEVVAARVVDGGIAVAVGADSVGGAGCGTGRSTSSIEPLWLQARLVVNAAGLAAPAVASRIAGFPAARQPQTFFSKGNYFALSGKAPFSRLVYPVPEPGGLGVHLTLDLAGQARFGPDVEWLDIASAHEIDYRVDARRADGFYALIRRYWPGLPDGALHPAYAGVRPKLSRGTEADFVIQGPADHGVPGLVNLFGIESPGLTSSLAIARRVAALR